MVRRTACVATQRRKTIKPKNTRMLFGQENERILQQLGLLDTIYTLDMLELETESDATIRLRRAMIDRTCVDGQVFTSDVSITSV
jgi:hypothetical protein